MSDAYKYVSGWLKPSTQLNELKIWEKELEKLLFGTTTHICDASNKG